MYPEKKVYDAHGASQRVPITSIQEDLLLALACEGQMTMYDLAKYDAKRCKLRNVRIRHYPSVLRAMKRLKESGFVKVGGHGRGKKGAKTILYELTTDGLWWLIPSLRAPMLRRIAEKNRELLPEVFDLWPSLSPEAEKIAVGRLQLACRAAKGSQEIPDIFIDPRIRAPSADERMHEGWYDAIRGNEKLKAALSRSIDRKLAMMTEKTSGLLRLVEAPELELMKQRPGINPGTALKVLESRELLSKAIEIAVQKEKEPKMKRTNEQVMGVTRKPTQG